MKTVGFLQVPFNCQPCYFLDIWLLQTRNHSTPSSRYNWECGWTPRLRRAGGCVNRWKTTSLIFATLIHGNFSVRHLVARPVWSIALTGFFYSPTFMCRVSSKMLVVSTSSRAVHSLLAVPMTVEKASSSSCNKKSLLDCLFHTRKSKTLCNPVAVQAIWKQLWSLRKALCISEEASCCHASHSTSSTFTS